MRNDWTELAKENDKLKASAKVIYEKFKDVADIDSQGDLEAWELIKRIAEVKP